MRWNVSFVEGIAAPAFGQFANLTREIQSAAGADLRGVVMLQTGAGKKQVAQMAIAGC
jgi:hypothetical protein